MLCVCGHDRAAHQLAIMSVPLVSQQPKPAYLLDYRKKGLNLVHPYATYEQYRCACGCCQFDPDYGD